MLARIGGLSVCAVIAFTPLALHAHETYTIQITDKAFVPNSIEISEGDAIIFINEGSSSHWPASNNHPTHTVYPGSDIRLCGTEDQKEIFDACRGLGTGEKFTFTFPQAGVWKFHDHLHPNLGGEITVKGPVGTTTPASEESSLTKVEYFMTFLLRLWYFFVPSAGEWKLETLNMMEVTHHEHELEYWIRVFGYEPLLDELVREAPPLDGEEVPMAVRDSQCHTEAHFLGRMAYRIGGLTLKDEAQIDTRCQFGFYHGVMESLLGSGGDNVVLELAATCLQYKGEDAMQRLFCQHSIGHGIMLYNNYDLPEAIKKCHELLGTGNGQRMCYHGAFMENIFASIGIATAGHETTWVDATRQDFPCDSPELPDFPHVKEECYQNQSILWSEHPLTDFNEGKAFAGCLRAPPEFRSLCFGGIGQNILLLPNKNRDDNEAITKCQRAPKPEDRRDCLIAALHFKNVLVWRTEGFRNADFCSALGMPNLFKCDVYVRKALAWLFEPEERI